MLRASGLVLSAAEHSATVPDLAFRGTKIKQPVARPIDRICGYTVRTLQPAQYSISKARAASRSEATEWGRCKSQQAKSHASPDQRKNFDSSPGILVLAARALI
jgi:hypothetical protein